MMKKIIREAKTIIVFLLVLSMFTGSSCGVGIIRTTSEAQAKNSSLNTLKKKLSKQKKSVKKLRKKLRKLEKNSKNAVRENKKLNKGTISVAFAHVLSDEPLIVRDDKMGLRYGNAYYWVAKGKKNYNYLFNTATFRKTGNYRNYSGITCTEVECIDSDGPASYKRYISKRDDIKNDIKNKEKDIKSLKKALKYKPKFKHLNDLADVDHGIVDVSVAGSEGDISVINIYGTEWKIDMRENINESGSKYNKINWSVSNGSIAEINKKGILKIKNLGSFYLTAKDSGTNRSCKVKIMVMPERVDDDYIPNRYIPNRVYVEDEDDSTTSNPENTAEPKATDTPDHIQTVPEGYTPVRTIDDLLGIDYNPEGSYILMNDIDISIDSLHDYGYDAEYGWNPLDTFSGVFDGNGYSITGMGYCGNILSQNEICSIGLFQSLDDGKVENLHMENVNIDINIYSVKYAVGAIAGNISNSSVVSRCSVSGKISVSEINKDEPEYDEEYEPTAEPMATIVPYYDSFDYCAGGLVGFSSGDILESYNLANVYNGYRSGDSCTGGIAGYSKGDNKYNYNLGNIGVSEYVNEEKCYVGGIIGYVGENGNVIESYNAGNLDNKNYSNCGAIAGRGEAKNCYYLIGTAERGLGNKGDKDGECIGLDDDQMVVKDSYNRFDFDEIWELYDSSTGTYPQLRKNRQIKYIS